MTPMSVVLAKAALLNLKIQLCDKRTLYIDGRPCQIIKSKWYRNFPGCRAMSMYMPRNEFADFLIYVPEGQDSVYVVPRGKISHDTGWAESALESYKDAWHLLKETNPLLFERNVVSLSAQLRKIIAAAEIHKLNYELIRSKRAERKNDYRMYAQRRIIISGRRCAIFTANMLPENSHPWDTAFFSAPKDDWAEILLYILGDDVYVLPRNQIHHDTTLDLQSSRIYDYKNSWCVLAGVDPTSSKQTAKYRVVVGRPEMIKKLWGITCADCKSFIVMKSYAVERAEQTVDVRFSEGGETIKCPKCGLVCAYSERDVQHRLSPTMV